MTGPTVLDGEDAIRSAVGTHLGYSDWLTIDQDRINLFADAGGDRQWIHVDVERANAGPFGAPIAHGQLILSLSNMFQPQFLEVRGFAMGVNYGLEKVRFVAPVKVGANIRGGGELVSATDVPGGVQTLIRITIEIEGSERPACVIDALSRWLH